MLDHIAPGNHFEGSQPGNSHRFVLCLRIASAVCRPALNTTAVGTSLRQGSCLTGMAKGLWKVNWLTPATTHRTFEHGNFNDALGFQCCALLTQMRAIQILRQLVNVRIAHVQTFEDLFPMRHLMGNFGHGLPGLGVRQPEGPRF